METTKHDNFYSKSRKFSIQRMNQQMKREDDYRKIIYTKIFAKTGFSLEKICLAHEKFDQEYPQGKITKEEFNNQSDVNIAKLQIFQEVSLVQNIKESGYALYDTVR